MPDKERHRYIQKGWRRGRSSATGQVLEAGVTHSHWLLGRRNHCWFGSAAL